MQDLNSTNLACGLNLQPACRGMDWRLSIYGAVNWLELLLRWWVVQDLNSTNLAYGLNLQPACRGMDW
ncbi:hypothetical protein [Providencia rettgeri]|uniref:hypothetical protein n=1 Tax=Providencia rettgeri TaxID=587 RepID=UPI00141A6149|nr:hypothetical protein [Providencia rettgeri]NIH04648.1 hypothetical protein [Providencia rettgeri]